MASQAMFVWHYLGDGGSLGVDGHPRVGAAVPREVEVDAAAI